MKEFHESLWAGHQSVWATFTEIKERYWWEGMYKDVALTPATQNRGYNRPPRPFFQRQNWQPSTSSDGVLRCTYCDKDGHK